MAAGIGLRAGWGGPGRGRLSLSLWVPYSCGRRDEKGCDSFWEARLSLRAPTAHRAASPTHTDPAKPGHPPRLPHGFCSLQATCIGPWTPEDWPFCAQAPMGLCWGMGAVGWRWVRAQTCVWDSSVLWGKVHFRETWCWVSEEDTPVHWKGQGRDGWLSGATGCQPQACSPGRSRGHANRHSLSPLP